MYDLVCQQCGKAFQGIRSYRRFCSDTCRRKYFKHDFYEKKIAMKAKRKCHDCGMATWDYRCEKCRDKWRKKHKVTSDAIEQDRFYSIGWM